MISAAEFIDRLADMGARQPRVVAALAGAPGSGKSTSAEAIVSALETRSPGFAVLAPMDGFHFDDSVLRARSLLPRKGAPETFDVGGLATALRRLRTNEEAEVALPVFDRALEISRAGARIAPRSARVILVEGNYLLLDEAPWSALRESFDLTAFIRCPEETLRRRLLARWTDAGFPAEEARRRAEENDLPNARRVIRASRDADIEIDGTAPLPA